MVKYHTEAEKEMCEKRMGKIIKVIAAVMILPAIFCVIQMIKGVFSIWNIFPAALCLIICLNVFIPGSFSKIIKKLGPKETTPQAELDRQEAELQADMKANPQKYKKKDGMALDSYYSKLKAGDILLRLVLVVGLCVGAYFSINHSVSYKTAHPGCSVVEVVVVSQKDKSYTTTEYDDDGTTITEHRSCVAELKYVFNGEERIREVTFQNIGEIKVTTFDIYIDADGEFLKTTASVTGFLILGITLAVLAFMLLTSIVLKFSPVFYLMLALFAIGPVILSLVGTNVSFAELLYFDLTTFILTFSCIGLYMMLAQYIGRLVIVGHAEICAPEKKVKQKQVDAQAELDEMMRTDDNHNVDDKEGNN